MFLVFLCPIILFGPLSNVSKTFKRVSSVQSLMLCRHRTVPWRISHSKPIFSYPHLFHRLHDVVIAHPHLLEGPLLCLPCTFEAPKTVHLIHSQEVRWQWQKGSWWANLPKIELANIIFLADAQKRTSAVSFR